MVHVPAFPWLHLNSGARGEGLFSYPIILLAFGVLSVRTSPAIILADGGDAPVLRLFTGNNTTPFAGLLRGTIETMCRNGLC